MNITSSYTRGEKAAFWSVVWFIIALVLFGLWRLIFVTNVEVHELGFAFNRFSGKIEVFTEKGWVVRNPIQYAVHQIDLRPRQVQIAANSRILNAKLVRFNPAGLDKFIEWHGRKGAEGSVSTGGRGESSEPMLYEILKSYAFDVDGGATCPFLTVENELAKQGEKLAAAAAARK
jgi:hypothetical protein